MGTTTRSDYRWPSLQKKPGVAKDSSFTPNFSVPRSKEFVYPSGILFQYENDIKTPRRTMQRTDKLPKLRSKSVSPKGRYHGPTEADLFNTTGTLSPQNKFTPTGKREVSHF